MQKHREAGGRTQTQDLHFTFPLCSLYWLYHENKDKAHKLIFASSGKKKIGSICIAQFEDTVFHNKSLLHIIQQIFEFLMNYVYLYYIYYIQTHTNKNWLHDLNEGFYFEIGNLLVVDNQTWSWL